MPDSRRRGRPALDATTTTPSVRVCLTVTAKEFDAFYQRARQEQTSIPEAIRRSLAGNKNLKNRHTGG
jgi:hypothetical protein